MVEPGNTPQWWKSLPGILALIFMVGLGLYGWQKKADELDRYAETHGVKNISCPDGVNVYRAIEAYGNGYSVPCVVIPLKK